MRDIPAMLSGYTAMVTGEPEAKVDSQGQPVVYEDGGRPHSVLLLMKQRPVPGEPRRKDGEEIKVNLPADPGEGFEAGTYVELINPVLNTFEIRDSEDPRRIANAGIWWKADGLKPVVSGGKTSKRGAGDVKSAGSDSGEAAA